MTAFFAITSEQPSCKGNFIIQTYNEGRASSSIFDVSVGLFSAVPGSPLAYWASDDLRNLFVKFGQFESEERTAKVGVQTSDDARFVRAWWEVEELSLGKKWIPFTKGGASSPYFADFSTVLAWDRDGSEIKAYAADHSRNVSMEPKYSIDRLVL